MRSMVTIWTLAVIILCAQPAWGASNNGFDTGLFYGIRSTTGDYLTHPAGDPLADWTAFSPEGDHAAWSLTFSGRGTNDARLFVMGNWGTSTPPGPWVSDFDGTGGVDGTIKIVEYNGSGSQIFQIYHGALLGCESNAPAAFRKISGGSIRYNPVNNTLIVSAKMMYYHILGGCTNMPPGMVDTIRTAYAWEFTLPSGGSTTLVETYVGPTVGALKLDAQNGDYGPSAIADGPVIDVGEDGTLYMIGPSVGTPLTTVRVYDDQCGDEPCVGSGTFVEGAQTSVTEVSVDDGAGGAATFEDIYVGNTIKFSISGELRGVSGINPTGGSGNGSIIVDSLITVSDNEEILTWQFRDLEKPTEQGDLIAFSTAGDVDDVTDTYVTLIDGANMGAGGTVPAYLDPQGLGVRGLNTPLATDDTIVILPKPNSDPHEALEFDLNAIDGNGDLQFLGAITGTESKLMHHAQRNPAWGALLITAGRAYNSGQKIYMTDGTVEAHGSGMFDIAQPPGTPDGACCYPGGACIDGLEEAECTAPGIWQGVFTSCATLDPPCSICYDPYPDADGDMDVDQDDFAIFQICYTGPGAGALPPTPAYCECFDRGDDAPDGDLDIDTFDFDKFQICASGPDVPADTGCDDPPAP